MLHILVPQSQDLIARSYLVAAVSLIVMQFLDILSFSFSILGIHGLIVLSLRHLIPYYITPSLSELLNETQRLLGRAETIGAIPLESEHRTHLDRYEDILICI